MSIVIKLEPPPQKRVFSKTLTHRAMKLGTHMQVPNANTPTKFQGHSFTITPFTPHMCGVQGHYANNVNFAFYPYDHIRMYSVGIDVIYIV